MKSLLALAKKNLPELLGFERIKRIVKGDKTMAAEFFTDWHLAQNPKYQDPRRLNKFEYQVLSQFGEDGILNEIFKRIGATSHYFVEFGVGNGMENNSASLLLQGWKGLWIEADDDSAAFIRQHFRAPIARGQLTLLQSFVDKDNIESLFAKAGVPAEFDLLSIDIDGNDYWIWKAIRNYRPRVVVVEYNATFGPGISWVMPYNATHRFDDTNYFGASLKAFEQLFHETGYRLVGCGFAGINAFFVREDLVNESMFQGPFTSENHFEPARYFLFRKLGKTRSPRIFA